jgi:hypothetical protein
MTWGRTALEVPVVAEGIGMEEVALDDVGEGLDVLVRVERPRGTGHAAPATMRSSLNTRSAPTPICSGSR